MKLNIFTSLRSKLTDFFAPPVHGFQYNIDKLYDSYAEVLQDLFRELISVKYDRYFRVLVENEFALRTDNDFDKLNSERIIKVIRIGGARDQSDFVENIDFEVVNNEGIRWLSPRSPSPGQTYFISYETGARSEALEDNFASLIPLPTSIFKTTETKRDFLEAVWLSFFLGSTRRGIFRGLSFLFPDALIGIIEDYRTRLFDPAQDPVTRIGRFSFKTNIIITTENLPEEFAERFSLLQKFIQLIKPAHTLGQPRPVFVNNSVPGIGSGGNIPGLIFSEAYEESIDLPSEDTISFISIRPIEGTPGLDSFFLIPPLIVFDTGLILNDFDNGQMNSIFSLNGGLLTFLDISENCSYEINDAFTQEVLSSGTC